MRPNMSLEEAKTRMMTAVEQEPFGTMNSLIQAIESQKGCTSRLDTRVATQARRELVEEGFLLKSRSPIKKNPKYKPPADKKAKRPRK